MDSKMGDAKGTIETPTMSSTFQNIHFLNNKRQLIKLI